MRAIRKRTVRVALAALIGLVLVAAVALSIGLVRRAGLMRTAYGAAYAQRPYDATTPQLDINSSHRFTFKLNKGVDLDKTTAAGKKRSSDDTALSDVAQVFSDPALQHQVPAQVGQLKGEAAAGQMVVAPPSTWVYADVSGNAVSASGTSGSLPNPAGDESDVSRSVIELTPPDIWGGFARYYLVRYVGADGKKLARPVVTMFTVKAKAFATGAPATVRTSVAPDGALHVSWTPVAGATGYQVMLERTATWMAPVSSEEGFPSAYTATAQRASSPRFSVVGQATGAEATSTAIPGDLFTGAFKISEDGIEQNRAFVEAADGVNPFDVDVAPFSTRGNGRIALAVVALKGSARSPLEFRSLTASLLRRIPLTAATCAQQQLKAQASRPGAGAGAGTQAMMSPAADATAKAMTMADGSTALVTGTNADPLRFVYSQSKTDWAAYKNPPPKTTMATVPYPVNGSCAFVKFLASNLMAGNYYLDVTTYEHDANAPQIDDALEEAISQNPYILYDNLSAQPIERGGKHLIYITSFYQIKDWKSLQQQLWAKVRAVDAQIITSGMSNEAKALAINSWLIAHASYDYTAADIAIKGQKNGSWSTDAALSYYDQYAYAQNATGVMLRGSGVCASYAAAFKALADRAGLPCVYVTGTVKSTGEQHAWNKVDLGGRWLIVDSAWNDESYSPTRFFGLTDNSKLSDRTQDDDFMVDAYVSRYAN